MGSYRCSGGGRQKEPDVALVQRGPDGLEDWPSIVNEVGVAKTPSALRRDANFWIRKSGGLTRVVLLMVVDVIKKVIMVERWGHVPPVDPSHVAGPNIRGKMIQTVSVVKIGGVSGAPLLVPSDLIFDGIHTPPAVLPTDVVFNAQDLIVFSREY